LVIFYYCNIGLIQISDPINKKTSKIWDSNPIINFILLHVCFIPSTSYRVQLELHTLNYLVNDIYDVKGFSSILLKSERIHIIFSFEFFFHFSLQKACPIKIDREKLRGSFAHRTDSSRSCVKSKKKKKIDGHLLNVYPLREKDIRQINVIE